MRQGFCTTVEGINYKGINRALFLLQLVISEVNLLLGQDANLTELVTDALCLSTDDEFHPCAEGQNYSSPQCA